MIQKNAVFADNMRKLAKGYPNFSELCREIGFNRVQMRRYLDGERWPQEAPLAIICAFFEVDARILHMPLDVIKDDYFGFTLPPLTWKQVTSNLWTASIVGLMYSRAMIEVGDGIAFIVSVKGVTVYDGRDLIVAQEAARKDAERRIGDAAMGRE